MTHTTQDDLVTFRVIVTQSVRKSRDITVGVPGKATAQDIVNAAVAAAMAREPGWSAVADSWCGRVVCDEYILEPAEADYETVQSLLDTRARPA